MIACGIDIGSATIKAVLLKDGGGVASALVKTGSRPSENARGLLDGLLSEGGYRRQDVARITATGYGRNYFKGADSTASEIICHARGAARLFPGSRTVIDIGGQDSKVISLDEGGRARNFQMNDRCAAGTGKFLEMVSMMLDIPLKDMGPMAEGAEEACEISSICAVFAESEIIGLTQNGTPLDAVLRGVFRSVARRVLSMSGRMGLVPDVVFTGGVALNQGVVRAFEEACGIALTVPLEPQLTGALGAALMAAEQCEGNAIESKEMRI